MTLETFKQNSFPLDFMLGEITFFSLPLGILEYKKHFSEVTETFEELSFENMDLTDYSGVLLRSFPVSQTPEKWKTQGDFIFYCPASFPRFFLEKKDQSFEEYLNGFSSKSRSTLKRKIKKFDQFTETSDNWKTYKTLSEMEDFYKLARIISSKTYQERLLDAGLPVSPQFKEHMKTLAKGDAVRGYILFHHDKPITYLYSEIENNNIHMYSFLGYDPDYKEWSPGTVLQFKLLKDLFDQGKPFLFDFTEGGGEHKRLFSTGSQDCANILCLKKNAIHFLVTGGHLAFTECSLFLKKISEDFHIKTKLKNWIRKYYK